MQTRPGICKKKARYETQEDALRVAERATITLRPYRCSHCRRYHLTSRTKGMKLPKFEQDRRRNAE